MFPTQPKYRERNGGPPAPGLHGLGDIVMVKEGRGRGVPVPRGLPDRLVPDGAVWPEGRFGRLDAVIWCTGFAPALEHLAPLGVIEPDRTCASRALARSAGLGCGWSGTAAGPGSRRRR